MLGWVTLQFIKATRVLKSLVSLESKFQKKPWAPKYHQSATSGLRLCIFLFTLKEPRGTESLWGPQDYQQPGTRCEVSRADLWVPPVKDWWQYQEPTMSIRKQRLENTKWNPWEYKGPCTVSKSVQKVKGSERRTVVKLKDNTISSGCSRLFLECDQVNEYTVRYYFLLCLGISLATFTLRFFSL